MACTRLDGTRTCPSTGRMGSCRRTPKIGRSITSTRCAGRWRAAAQTEASGRRCRRALTLRASLSFSLSFAWAGAEHAGAAVGAVPERPAAAVPARATAIAVRMVVIANFENGADMGDKPGEYQFWVEREHLDQALKVRGASGPVRRNDQGLYGLLLQNLTPFLLDPRFDFSKTYWLFTGISGVDPQVASVGSAAWARWVINGDELREIDDREIPAAWPYGLFAIGSMKPNTLPTDPNSFGCVDYTDELVMAYPLNLA